MCSYSPRLPKPIYVICWLSDTHCQFLHPVTVSADWLVKENISTWNCGVWRWPTTQSVCSLGSRTVNGQRMTFFVNPHTSGEPLPVGLRNAALLSLAYRLSMSCSDLGLKCTNEGLRCVYSCKFIVQIAFTFKLDWLRRWVTWLINPLIAH